MDSSDLSLTYLVNVKCAYFDRASSGVASIDATTHVRAQTNHNKNNNVIFCSRIYK